MENNERDRKLDQWLDEALSQYSAAEPRLGLEKRVLAHVRAEEQSREGRRSWWRWMPAFAAIAAVLIVMVEVQPYWEEKTARKVLHETASGLEKKQSPETKSDAMSAALQPPSQTRPESRASTSTKKVAADRSENFPAKRKARVQAAEEFSQATQVAADAAVTKDVQRARLGNPEDILNPKMVTRQETTVIPNGTGTGASGGVMPSTTVAAIPRPATPARTNVLQLQTVQVQSAAAPVPTEQGLVATDRLPASAEGSVQVRTVQVTPTANASPTANTMEVMGVMLRTDDITSQPRQAQQFPTPVPLSKQEKLMLAASKQLQEKPAASDKKKDEITPIELKRIDIEPLPGPEK